MVASSFAARVRELPTFYLRSGAQHTIRFPQHGPFDQRLGYVRLPVMLNKLQAKGFFIDRQVRFSHALQTYVGASFYPPSQAGLSIRDVDQQSMFQFHYPRHAFASFDEVPPLLVEALLFIEDRRLLSDESSARESHRKLGPFSQGRSVRSGRGDQY